MWVLLSSAVGYIVLPPIGGHHTVLPRWGTFTSPTSVGDIQSFCSWATHSFLHIQSYLSRGTYSPTVRGTYSPSPILGHIVLLQLGDIQSFPDGRHLHVLHQLGDIRAYSLFSVGGLWHTVLLPLGEIHLQLGTYSPSSVGTHTVFLHIHSYLSRGTQSYFSWATHSPSSVGGHTVILHLGDIYSPSSVGGHTVLLQLGDTQSYFSWGTYSPSPVWGNTVILQFGDIQSFFGWGTYSPSSIGDIQSFFS